MSSRSAVGPEKLVGVRKFGASDLSREIGRGVEDFFSVQYPSNPRLYGASGSSDRICDGLVGVRL